MEIMQAVINKSDFANEILTYSVNFNGAIGT